MTRPGAGAVTAFFLFTVIGTVLATLFLLAVTAGRHQLCRFYEHRTDGPSYCYAGATR